MAAEVAEPHQFQLEESNSPSTAYLMSGTTCLLGGTTEQRTYSKMQHYMVSFM